MYVIPYFTEFSTNGIAVMTFSASTPPLPEVLILWDFLIAYGPHMNILCVIGQLILMRDQLMAHSSPNKLLRQFPKLDARKCISIAVSMIPTIGDLYAPLSRHCWDEAMIRDFL